MYGWLTSPSERDVQLGDETYDENYALAQARQ